MEIGEHLRTLQVEPVDATQPATVEHAPPLRRENDAPEPVGVGAANTVDAGAGVPVAVAED